MGCQSSVVLGNNLTFSICTHDADTGALTDTSAAPAYRVYEDETAAAILNGTMAKLDDANTLGFYTELIACTGANGFAAGQSYTVYIEAIVDGVTRGIAYSFTVVPADVVVATGGIVALSFESGAIDAAATSTDFATETADALLDRANGIETGLTPRNALRLVAASTAGKLSGAATATVVCRNAVADSKDRLTVTTDADGNRTAITPDLT
jgi:hypothetical protein